MRCLALFTGGLDSQIAVRLLQRQGMEVIGVQVATPFTGTADGAALVAARLGIELRRLEWGRDYLQLLAGPRLGFAWDPRGDARISVRGGYGIMYERLFNNSITNIRFNPPFYSFAVANPVQAASQAGIRIAYGPMNPDGTIRNEAPSITGDNRNIGVPADLPVFGNIIGWNPAFGTSQQSLRVPDPYGRDAYYHSWFGGVQLL